MSKTKHVPFMQRLSAKQRKEFKKKMKELRRRFEVNTGWDFPVLASNNNRGRRKVEII